MRSACVLAISRMCTLSRHRLPLTRFLYRPQCTGQKRCVCVRPAKNVCIKLAQLTGQLPGRCFIRKAATFALSYRTVVVEVLIHFSRHSNPPTNCSDNERPAPNLALAHTIWPLFGESLWQRNGRDARNIRGIIRNMQWCHLAARARVSAFRVLPLTTFPPEIMSLL